MAILYSFGMSGNIRFRNDENTRATLIRQSLNLNWPIILITPITPLTLLMIAKLNFTLKVYFFQHRDDQNTGFLHPESHKRLL